MDLEKIFNDEYNAYSEIQHLIGGKIVNESMPCINKEKFIEVVKKLLIHDVRQRSELLVDFWMNLPNTNKNKGVAKHYVDEYLESTNCA